MSIKLVDSHCHLNMLKRFGEPGGLESILDDARNAGVSECLCVNVDREHLSEVLTIAAQHESVYASVGIHPNEPTHADLTIDQLIEYAKAPTVLAIGETGLDNYRNEGDLTWQHERFRRHIRAAIKVKKPLIVHSRMAREETINILKEERAEQVGGVLHCFTETLEMAETAMEMGFYISFSGIITFKNAQALQTVVKAVPLERILIETDAPYLAPEPFRGQPNEPARVRYVAEKIAALKAVSIETVAEQTTLNFDKVFKR